MWDTDSPQGWWCYKYSPTSCRIHGGNQDLSQAHPQGQSSDHKLTLGKIQRLGMRLQQFRRITQIPGYTSLMHLFFMAKENKKPKHQVSVELCIIDTDLIYSNSDENIAAIANRALWQVVTVEHILCAYSTILSAHSSNSPRINHKNDLNMMH